MFGYYNYTTIFNLSVIKFNTTKEKRKKQKLTQEDLAEKLGVSNKAVSKCENGINMPDLSLFKPLCNILNISINELLCGENIKEENYNEKLEENILNLTNYEHNKKINKDFLILIIIGVIIYLLGCIYHESNIIIARLFEITGILFIIYSLIIKNNSFKYLITIITILVMIIPIKILYKSRIENGNSPLYYYSKKNINNCNIYKSLFNNTIILKKYSDIYYVVTNNNEYENIVKICKNE